MLEVVNKLIVLYCTYNDQPSYARQTGGDLLRTLRRRPLALSEGKSALNETHTLGERVKLVEAFKQHCGRR